jgi:hypothetical protein
VGRLSAAGADDLTKDVVGNVIDGQATDTERVVLANLHLTWQNWAPVRLRQPVPGHDHALTGQQRDAQDPRYPPLPFAAPEADQAIRVREPNPETPFGPLKSQEFSDRPMKSRIT